MMQQHRSCCAHSSLDARAQAQCTPCMQPLTQHRMSGQHMVLLRVHKPAAQLPYRRARVHSTAADSQADLYSLGVQLKPYNNDEALAAVSNKSFSCTMCGKCCTMAADAEVWISDAEVSAMASHLAISPATFSALYCQPYHSIPGWKLLSSKQQQQQQQQQRELPAPATAAGITGQPAAAKCVFLDETSNGCTVYPVRPVQCSTYPWWPELMSDKHWKLEQEYMCEGFDHPTAEPLDRWHAAQQLQKATQHTMALEAAKPAGWDAQQQLYGHGSSSSNADGS